MTNQDQEDVGTFDGHDEAMRQRLGDLKLRISLEWQTDLANS